MNTFKNLFNCNIIMSRAYSRKKSSLFYNQWYCMSTQQHQTEKEAFHAVLPEVIDTVAAHVAVAEIPNLKGWINKLFVYNLSGGKGARGQTVVTAYEMLEKSDKVTEDSMRLARILGWCVEMFQSYVILIDDMMDGSTTRRGQPCWYLMPEVGTRCAINDAVIVFNGMFYVMRKNFGDRPNYSDMLDTINETLLKSSFGQFLDYKTSELSNTNYSNLFTPERHLAIIKHKTAYYTYDLPIYLGFLLTGNKLDGNIRKRMQEISLDLGLLFQTQDDYIDCYTDESLSGKFGTDIQEGKCSWLAVNALQRCNDAQRIVFNSCYGSKEPAHVERIKWLYDQLQLPELFKQEEARYYNTILENIKHLPTEEMKRLFRTMLDATYQRKK